MKAFGLIGKKLDHSFSKRYFTQKFQELNLPYSYSNFEIESIDEFPDIVAKNPDLRGLNVTIPYKTKIISHLDWLDDTSTAIQAVNTIKISNGELMGYNTDVDGFKWSIKPFLKHGMERALILGTGGASKAVAYALKGLGLDVLFVSRSPSATDEVSYSDLNQNALHFYKLIVNTTPLGTFPDVDQQPPIPYEFLNSDHLLYDLTYNPAETNFMKLGKARGATTMNGLNMLKLQAEKSWEIWNARDV